MLEQTIISDVHCVSLLHSPLTTTLFGPRTILVMFIFITKLIVISRREIEHLESSAMA